jgi:uncharacterized LabA/DUF88 family protein
MKISQDPFTCIARTLAIFIDYHNLEGSLREEGLQADILRLREYLVETRRLLEAFLFVGLNPNNFHEDARIHRYLRANGFLVRTKLAKVRPEGSLKCNLDIEMALGVVEYVTNAHPDIVLLVTGDGDFVPLVQWLRTRGVRVEIASTPNAVSQDLRESANGYIDLREAIEEIEAVRGESLREEVKTNGNGNN